MRSWIVLGTWLCLGWGLVAVAQGPLVAPPPGKSDSAKAQQVDFHRQVMPILRKYCQGCHNNEDRDGKLSLESYAGILQGGEHGAVIAPGDSSRSRLILVLVGKARPAMPPEGSDPPSKQEIEILRRWIDQGAPGPQGKAPQVVLRVPRIPVQGQPRRPILAAAWSPDGKLVALGRYGQVELVDPQAQQTLRTLPGPEGNVNAVAFSPDGAWLAAAGGQPGLRGQVFLWSTRDWKLRAKWQGHRDAIYALAFSPDGKHLATASYDHQVAVWSVHSGSALHWLKGHNAPVYSLAWSSAGPWLATAAGDRTVKLWHALKAKRLETFGQPLKEQYTVTFSPDGRRVVAAGADNRLRMWSLGPQAQEGTNRLLYSRFAHQRPIIRVVWAPRGDLLASSAEGGQVKLWKASVLRELRVLEQQPDWAVGLAFSPQGDRLFVGRLDGSWAIYDTSSGARVPPPPPQLAAVRPWAWQLGQKVRVSLRGKQLHTVSLAQVSIPGAQVRILQRSQPNQLELEVQLPTRAPVGKHSLWVQGPGGKSNSWTVFVDPLPQLLESEPNDKPTQAQPVKLESGIWGTIASAGDADYYALQLQGGEPLVVMLEGALVGSKLNGVLTLFDEHGRLLASSNDFDQHADPVLYFRVPQAGKYLLRVTDLQSTGSKDHRYRLTVGTFPLVTGAMPLVAPAGQEVEVHLVGFNVPKDAVVKVKVPPKGSAAVPVDRLRYRVRKSPRVHATSWPVVQEQEPNDLPAQATVVPVPGGVQARMWPKDPKAPTDVDYFRLELQAGQTVVIETLAHRFGSPVDTRIEVLDAQGRVVPRLLLQAVRDSYITFRPIDSDQIEARVGNWEEMELNQYLYMNGEVVKLYRLPRGPDSGFVFYTVRGKRRCYFDTSPKAHALDEPCFIVEPHPLGTRLVPNGLPVFTIYYENDDDAMRRWGRDSVLTFTAPRAGTYYIRVEDTQGAWGPHHTYHLLVRPRQPGFQVSFAPRQVKVPRGSGRQIVFTVDRQDGFEGPVEIQVQGLPSGFHITQPLVVQEGHVQAWAVLWADPDAPDPKNHPPAKVFASASVEGQTVRKQVGTLGPLGLAKPDPVLVQLEPREIVIRPGTTVTAKLKIVRQGFKQRVTFDVNNLPHGVYVDNIGLNGVLIPPGQTERTIFLTARPWVPPGRRPAHALAKVRGNPCSAPVVIRVEPAGTTTAQTSRTSPPSGTAPKQ